MTQTVLPAHHCQIWAYTDTTTGQQLSLGLALMWPVRNIEVSQLVIHHTPRVPVSFLLSKYSSVFIWEIPWRTAAQHYRILSGECGREEEQITDCKHLDLTRTSQKSEPWVSPETSHSGGDCDPAGTSGPRDGHNTSGMTLMVDIDGSISSICRFSLIYVGNIYCLYPTCQVIK